MYHKGPGGRQTDYGNLLYTRTMVLRDYDADNDTFSALITFDQS